MARSLTIQPEENPTTSRLLNGFLLFVVGWLVLGVAAAVVTGDVAEAEEIEAAR